MSGCRPPAVRIISKGIITVCFAIFVGQVVLGITSRAAWGQIVTPSFGDSTANRERAGSEVPAIHADTSAAQPLSRGSSRPSSLAPSIGQNFLQPGVVLASYQETGSSLTLTDAVNTEAPGKVEQDLAAEVADLRRRLDLLVEHPIPDAKINATPRDLKEDAAEGKALQAAASAGGAAAKSTTDDKWTVKLGGHVQLDYVTWADTDPGITDLFSGNYFSYRRLRLVANGSGYRQFDFRLQMTLEPGQGVTGNQLASPDVKDAYLSMNEIPVLGRMRIGNFFVPFSLEQVTNDTNNIFSERSIPSQGIFAVDREVGIAFYNCNSQKTVTWASGVFFDNLNDTIKTRIDNNQGYRTSGRLTWLPYYDAASHGRYLVHTGVGILHTSDHDDRVRFASRPQVQRGPVLIDSGVLAADTYTTGNLEGAIVWGRVTLQTEAFISQVNLLSDQAVHLGGVYAHLSYFLTGENRIFERFGQHGPQFGRNSPHSYFFNDQDGRGWGAWELKTRWSLLDLTDIDRGQYNDLTAGFNWYWSDRTRWMFDWIHPLTDQNTVFGSTESDLLALRFDFNW